MAFFYCGEVILLVGHENAVTIFGFDQGCELRVAEVGNGDISASAEIF
jgi:hypothetical protein